MGLYNNREIQFATESSFGENASTPSSNTWTTRIPVISVDSGPPDHSRGENDGSVQNRQNEGRPGFYGARSARFDFTCYLGGHDTTTAAGLSTNWKHTLMGGGLGGNAADMVGGTVATGSSATQFTYSGATGKVHEIIRVGAKGDARADGQAAVIDTVNTGTSTITLLTALPGTPTTADVIWAGLNTWPIEAPTASQRFLHAFDTTGFQYHFMGCALDKLGFKFPIGGLPTISYGYTAAYWDRSAVTIPSALALEDNKATIVAGGSVFFQTTGTATRVTLSPEEINLTLDVGTAFSQGPASGQAAYQTINGYARTRCIPTIEMLVPASTTVEGYYSGDGSDSTYKQILVTLNTVDGKAVAFYMPRAYPIGPKPTYEDKNGQRYMRIRYRGRESAVTTSELTRSAIRFFLG